MLLAHSATPELLQLLALASQSVVLAIAGALIGYLILILRKPCLSVFPGRFAMPAASSPYVDLAFGSGIGLHDFSGSTGLSNWEKESFR